MGLGISCNACNNKIDFDLPQKPVNSPKQRVVIAKGDSAATHNYWRKVDTQCLMSIKPVSPCNVILTNFDIMQSTHSGQLPLSNKLSTKAKDALILPKLTSSSLISLGQLCDDDYKVILDKRN